MMLVTPSPSIRSMKAKMTMTNQWKVDFLRKTWRNEAVHWSRVSMTDMER